MKRRATRWVVYEVGNYDDYHSIELTRADARDEIEYLIKVHGYEPGTYRYAKCVVSFDQKD